MTTHPRELDRTGGLSPQLIVGVILIAIAWPLAWLGPTPYAAYTFTPLWLGYILTVDGLTVLRSGTSLLMRDAKRFGLLFAFSIPLWWLFEFANRFLGNWEYVGVDGYGLVSRMLVGSIRFSTVMPAVFVTAELWRTIFRGELRWIRIAPGRGGLLAIVALGLAMFIGSLVFPNMLFPLVWIGLFLLLDPINALAGRRSIVGQLARRRWDTVLVLFAAGLTCGFFWEMWNYWSPQKWVYHVPHVGFFKVFEMPILGYGGYLPFALEIYAAYHLLLMLVLRQRDEYLTFDD